MTARRITVRADESLSDDLATLAAAGWSTSDAVRYAVALLADAQREAVARAVIPAGQRVEVTAATVTRRTNPCPESS